MNRRIRNLVLFAASVLGTALLVIGILAISHGDASGWRAIIGATFAFALVAVIVLRTRNGRTSVRPDLLSISGRFVRR